MQVSFVWIAQKLSFFFKSNRKFKIRGKTATLKRFACTALACIKAIAELLLFLGYELSTFLQYKRTEFYCMLNERWWMRWWQRDWLIVWLNCSVGGRIFCCEKLLPTIKRMYGHFIKWNCLEFHLSNLFCACGSKGMCDAASITTIIRRLHRMGPFLHTWKIECGKETHIRFAWFHRNKLSNVKMNAMCPDGLS